MSGPRNRPAFEAGAELHACVTDLLRLTNCQCCGRPRLTAKELRRHLPERFQNRSDRTLRIHIAAALLEISR